MGKISLNFADPFGMSPHTLNVDEKVAIKELTRLLAEELGYVQADNNYVSGLFKNNPVSPVIYDPKAGILAGELSLDKFSSVKNNTTLSYYVFPPNALAINDILLENNGRLGLVSLVVTVEWAGNYFPVILPAQIKQEDVALIKFIFAQLKTILGIQAMPQGWQSPRWQLLNIRTGERMDGGLVGNLTEKIRHGDTLRLLPKTRNEQDDIVILDEKQGQVPDELDIKIGDELLDSITIEQPEPIKINNCLIELIQGDITLQEMEAIVNAAKAELTGGGGVDGAIHQAAGPSLVRASSILSPCSPGKAVITPGFSLPSKWVIHTVGPIYQDGKHDEDKVLANAYQSSLAIAFFSGFSSIAFPAISTGIYGYPVDQAARVTWKTIKNSLLETKENPLKTLRIVVLDSQTYEAYATTLRQLS
jgi:O-acetyl-ADP-ribose deacetylase (regulator of RNase III)